MKKCLISGLEIDVRLIRANSSGFGKKMEEKFSVPFLIELDAIDAIDDFRTYYQDFVDREAEDEGFEEILDGYFLSLKESGYLPFEKMIYEQPELLAEVIKTELPAEFLGYVFLDKEASIDSKKYILQNLTEVRIYDGKIICTGYAFLNPKFLS